LPSLCPWPRPPRFLLAAMPASRARCSLDSRNTGSQLVTVGLPGPLSSAVEAWSEFADCSVSHVAKAAGFVRFALSVDEKSGRRVVEPRHYVIAFPLRDQGRQKHHSALFTLRVVREEDISRDPNAQGAVANHLRFKPPAERKLIPGADEYVEFELLSREHEVPSQQPMRISMGPVRSDKKGQKEFVRVDMGQCIQRIAADIIEDPKSGHRMVQNRWWMCIETLRLLCNVDHIDCSALDTPGGPPQEWVIRLMDTHAPVNRKEELQEIHEDRNIDDLMDFIDSSGGPAQSIPSTPSGGSKPSRPPRSKKKKGGEKDDVDGHLASDPSAVSGSTVLTGFGTALCAGGSSRSAASTEASAEEAGRRVSGVATPSPSSSSPTMLSAPASASSTAPSRGARVGGGYAGEEAEAEAQEDGGEMDEARPRVQRLPSFEDAADTDLMGELLSRYRRLQERSGRAEMDAKVAVIRDLLEVLDELERADAEIEEDSAASRVIFSAARKFEAKLRSMGLVRVEALGKPFDGALHRAVGEPPETGHTSQVVIEELESGWVLGKDVVRPALVSLG